MERLRELFDREEHPLVNLAGGCSLAVTGFYMLAVVQDGAPWWSVPVVAAGTFLFVPVFFWPVMVVGEWLARR